MQVNMSFCEITGTIFIFSAPWQLPLSNVQSFLSESSPLPPLLFKTSQWVTLSCGIDDQDDSDSNDLLLPHTLENLFHNCVTRAIRSLFEERYGLFFLITDLLVIDSIMPAPFQYLENTRHEKGFAVFWALFFGLLILGRLTIVECVWPCLT